MELGHRFNFDEPKLFANEAKLSKILFLEMVLINKVQNRINKRADIQILL